MHSPLLLCGNDWQGRQIALSKPDPERHSEIARSWITDPETAGPLMMDWEPTEEAYRERLRELPGANDRVAWMILIEGNPAGILVVRGLETDLLIGEPTVVVAPEYRRQGIACSALNKAAEYVFSTTFGLTYLHVTVRSDNQASLGLVKKVGFVEWTGSPALYDRPLKGESAEAWRGYFKNPRLFPKSSLK